MMSWKTARKLQNREFKPKNVKVGDRFKVVSKGNIKADAAHITEVILIENDGSSAPCFKDVNSETTLYINWFRLKRVKKQNKKENKMIKFNHESNDLQEALGISKEEILKELKAATKMYAENDEYTPTDRQKVVILATVLSDDGTRDVLQLFIPFLSKDEGAITSNSQVIEYLYRNLSEKAYSEILSSTFKAMMYSALGDL